ncbi:MAG: hypothetical protein ABMA13_10625 [Chthoniobacteraceae bacterium]
MRDYFLGTADIATLRADLQGAVTQTSHDVFSQHVISMDTDCDVSAAHLVSLCDAVLAGQLPAADLSVIAFCLVASDHFQWDTATPEGNLIGETLDDWDSPEINYPLNVQTVATFRHRLLTGEDTFSRGDIPKKQPKTRNA